MHPDIIDLRCANTLLLYTHPLPPLIGLRPPALTHNTYTLHTCICMYMYNCVCVCVCVCVPFYTFIWLYSLCIYVCCVVVNILHGGYILCMCLHGLLLMPGEPLLVQGVTVHMRWIRFLKLITLVCVCVCVSV